MIVDGTLSQLKLLTQQTDSVESMIMLRLDTARNHLLRIELMFTALTSVAAIGALIGGLFGMNLRSDLEEEPHLFWIIVGIVMIGGLVSFVSFLVWIRMRGYLVT
jgi:magnesium transporter